MGFLCNLAGYNSRRPCVSLAQGYGCNQRSINQTGETEMSGKRRQSILSSFTLTNMRYCYLLSVLHGAFDVIPKLGNGGLFVMRAQVNMYAITCKSVLACAKTLERHKDQGVQAFKMGFMCLQDTALWNYKSSIKTVIVCAANVDMLVGESEGISLC